MLLPLRRRSERAGSLLVARVLALACATAFFVSQAGLALASEPAATLHIRGEAGGVPGAALSSGDGQSLYAVAGREVDYPEPAPQPTVGESIAGFALAYVGYPYVAAGNTPAGFDCSGFTQWVMLNVLGVDIGHGLEGQPAAGWWVDYGAWQPGDLVFFQNTYKPGLSHVGIYIGDGLIVHAENEGTGVRISSIFSDYYSSRYWGAVRVA